MLFDCDDEMGLENRTGVFWDYLTALIIITGTHAVEVRCLMEGLESRPSSAAALADACSVR